MTNKQALQRVNAYRAASIRRAEDLQVGKIVATVMAIVFVIYGIIETLR